MPRIKSKEALEFFGFFSKAELEAERNRLRQLGCVEFNTISTKIGLHFRHVPLFSQGEIDNNPVLEVDYRVGKNKYGWRVHLQGNAMVKVTNDPLSESIYAENGLDFEEHSRILKNGW